MLFTTNDVVAYARDKAVRAGDVRLDPHMIARQINNRLRSLVRRVVSEDPERLAEEVVIDNTDTTASTTEVDLTASSTREWISIIGMDWRSADGDDYADEVVVGTIEARQRIETDMDYFGSPMAYFFDRMRKLKKVAGWDGVYDLRAYGVLQPTEIDPQDATNHFAFVMDYPEPMFRALQTGFLMAVAAHMKPSELELSLWANEHEEAMADVLEEAESFVGQGLRIEDVPHQEFSNGRSI